MSECIEWSGFRDKWGYGMCANGRGGAMFAHRKAWQETYGEIPAGLFVCHKCDNRACVNPKHLFLGTALDNNSDMESKGRARHPKGEEHGRAKINAATVSRILEMRATMTVKEIVVAVGLKKSQVYNILNGESWRHINCGAQHA